MQLLPEAPDREGPVRVMAQRLEDDFEDLGPRLLKTDADPQDLMNELLWGMKHTPLGDSPLRPGCECSRIRVMTTLSTLNRDDVRGLIAEGIPLDMNCDWCNAEYRVELAVLQGLVQPS